MTDRRIRAEIRDSLDDMVKILHEDDTDLAEWLIFNAGRCLGWAAALGHNIEICTIHPKDAGEKE